MKRILFAIIACCSLGLIQAEDVLNVAPVAIGTNVDKTGADAGVLTFSVTSDALQEITLVGCDVYVSKDIDLDDTYIEMGDQLPFTTNRGVKTYSHAVDFQACEPHLQDMDGYTLYKLNIYSTKGDHLVGSNGESLFSLYVGSTSKEGIFPVILKKVILARSGKDVVAQYDGNSSYVKVGQTASAYAPFGLITTAMNEALASETAISTLDLTNVTASNGTFAYVPGRNVVAPASEVVADVKATVAPTSTYASVCLPFDATIDCYTMSEVKDGWASFVDATSLAKNTPALVNKEVTATATGVALAAVSADVKTSGYYMKGGEFCRVNGSVTIPALRGWWDIAAEVRGFVIAGEETAINSVENAEPQVVYNVAGVRLNKVQRGVNIVNGKKVVLK